MDLVVMCYKVSDQFPPAEKFGLSGQIRRAAVSVPANIAEGHGRRNLGEYLQHLSVANGSLKELETHILIAGRLHFVEEQAINSVLHCCEEIGRMLATLIQRLRQKRNAAAKSRTNLARA